MKNTAKPTLALRAHSIRTLTANELRVANGGTSVPSLTIHHCARTYSR